MKLWTKLTALMVLILIPSMVFANETTVKIVAPEKAKVGEEVTIKIEVTHNGNNFLHFTDWVWVKVNGEEYKRWEFERSDRPENENFTLEFKLKIEGPTTITAKGNCNMHGSTGEEKFTIKIQEE